MLWTPAGRPWTGQLAVTGQTGPVPTAGRRRLLWVGKADGAREVPEDPLSAFQVAE